MVKIKMFGSLRLKTGFRETEAKISTVMDACRIISEMTGKDMREFKNCVVMLNGKQVKSMSSGVKDGDELVFLAPAGGG